MVLKKNVKPYSNVCGVHTFCGVEGSRPIGQDEDQRILKPLWKSPERGLGFRVQGFC